MRNDRGKRELVARTFETAGLTRLLELMPQRRVLMVLNYHRIGDASESVYDSGVFSATAAEFDFQVAYLKKRFHMATAGEAIEIVEGRSRPAGASALITFDDGYVDNFTSAFPILRSHGVQGLFFLPTGMVGTNHLPWWDHIAFVVKQSRAAKIDLSYPQPASFDLAGAAREAAVAGILRLYKSPCTKDSTRFLRELEQACGAHLPDEERPACFMNWDQARLMQAGGMAFGSHTHSHSVLTTLTAQQQEEEFRQSRRILESELQTHVDVLAYPVGGRHCFSAESIAGLRNAGYRAAFSFYGGLNRPGGTDLFDIRRVAVSGQSPCRLRLQASVGAMTGSRWF